MPVLKPNHRVIKAAKPINGKRTRYRIDGTEGLWLDVSATGKAYWYVRYQPGGRARAPNAGTGSARCSR